MCADCCGVWRCGIAQHAVGSFLTKDVRVAYLMLHINKHKK